METIKNFLKHRLTIGLLGLVLGGFLGWYVMYRVAPASVPRVVRVGIQNNHYKYIDPLLTYDISNDSGFLEYRPFEKKVNDLIDQLKAEGKISDAGFYFRGFKTGYWYGVNEEDKFSPGSLMKVPLMMAYFKLAQSNSQILSKRLVYEGNFDANLAEVYKPAEAIKSGQSYTVDELIRYMIVYSDNNAANLLLANINQNSFGEIFADLGVDLPDLTQGDKDFLTPKQYSLFFRILRNATYLNGEYSEKAMELLVDVDFPQGLLGGIPSNIEVADKYGEYLFHNPDGSQVTQLHDCGLIYYPGRPYFLCVMTKGKNYNDLSSAIQSISQMVYAEVDKNATGAK